MFLSTTGSVGTKTLTTKSGSGSAEWGKRELCGTSVGAPSLASPHVESRMSQVLSITSFVLSVHFVVKIFHAKTTKSAKVLEIIRVQDKRR